MCLRITVLYNAPEHSRYDDLGESKAVFGVLEAVEAVNNALINLKYPTTLVPLSPPVEEARRTIQSLKTELVFNLFEGFGGKPETEAAVARMLEEKGIAFTGNPSHVLGLALDKVKTKAVLEAAGIAAPKFQVLEPETIVRFRLRFPCIVKPCGEDASHGISEDSVVHNIMALERQVARVSRLYHGRALVEEYIDGREFNATVMGNYDTQVLPPSEIVYSLPPGKPKILTFGSKWEPSDLYYGCTKPVCPAEITPEKQAQIARVAKAAFLAIGCRGYARVDMREDLNGHIKVLEINPNPDVSPGTGAAIQAEAAGMTYEQFVQKLLDLALEASACEYSHSSPSC